MRSINARRHRQLSTQAELQQALSRASEPAANAAEEGLGKLQAHKAELERKNWELRQTCAALEASRDRYADLYEFAPIGYLTLTAKGLIAEINLAGAKLLGMERKKLIRRCFLRFVAEQDKARWQDTFLSMMADSGGLRECFDMILVGGDGSRIHAHLSCLRREGNGVSPMLCIALVDITELKQAEACLRIAATAFETQEGIFITDAENTILRVNQSFTRITGYGAEEVIGRTPSLLKSGRHDANFYAAMWDSLGNTGTWAGEIWNRRKNGEINPEWLTITAVCGGGNGNVTHYVAMLTDIAIQKAASEQVEHLTFYDPLTNLPNRRLLRDRLHQALAASARSRRQGALLFIDLDNFKTLNDTLGHDMGDLLLQQVAQRLLGNVREGDTAARLGGDEFVLMLNELSELPDEAVSQTEIAGKKILAALDEPYQLAGYHYRCTPSIGATLFGDHSAGEDELLKRVDIAMYQAKRTGRNTLCFYDQAMQAMLTASAALEADLRLALEKNQFKLYYQLQITHAHQVIGAEVLLRWQHPERGLISAREFIPLAEETGLILPIGQWVLEAACAQLKVWENNPGTRDLQLAVNISPRQFHQADFVEQVRAVLEKNAIDPARLQLELTESMVLDDVNGAIAKMRALNAIGVRFTLDDFGIGNSSLSLLMQLPFRQMKIDQSLVRNICVKSSDAVMVDIIIDMASHLGMNVITEGVETEDQRAFLERHGCPLCQGFLFSGAVPLEVFEQFASRNQPG